MSAHNSGLPSFAKYTIIRNAEAVATHARPEVGDIVFHLTGLFSIITAIICLSECTSSHLLTDCLSICSFFDIANCSLGS